MATIESLKTSILELPEEQKLKLILRRRESRLTPKKSLKAKATRSLGTGGRRKPKVMDHFAIAKTLPADQAAKLFEELMKKKKQAVEQKEFEYDGLEGGD